ncbi:DMT family transporter [Shewanella yunxiaonensis]|uniref:DMT family transporter n=1 Tax=Shewanella yunxiaonensis TaxID=2829809 RepID=A0ABX7YR31_9GAMM|nr:MULTISPECIES: DMT family transporter [Shewanella]MDF0533887.1 DMT family transporter [Shewanella sp. A32]QUN05069.1 DMT family transporter [Shewanella yunxiaonensis]
MKTSSQAFAYGLGAVLLWSTVATAFKIALTFFTPLQLVFVATIVSSLCLLVILGVQRKLPLLWQQFRARPLLYLQTGLLSPFLYYLVLFKAYDLLPAQQALSLNYTWGILLPLLSVPMLSQKLRASDLVAALIAYFGVLVIATEGSISEMHFESPLGIGLCFTSTILWCLYWIVNTKDKGDPVVSLLLSFLIALPCITLMLVCTQSLPQLSLKAILAGSYVGLFEMGITFVLWLMALKTATRTASISNLVFLSPVLSMCFIALILGEKILPSTLAGLGLIILALLLQRLLPLLGNHRRPKIRRSL